MAQTIGQQIKWDFKTNGYLKIRDKNGKLIYNENSDGYWIKYKRDSQGNEIYREHSTGFWSKCEYDSKGNKIYYEDSNGFWGKSVYDSQGKLIYSENSYGVIEDKRPKSCENKVVKWILGKIGIRFSR